MPLNHNDDHDSRSSDGHDFADGRVHEVGENAGERGSLVASIQYLAHQVPMWVLTRLGEETLEHEGRGNTVLDWDSQSEEQICCEGGDSSFIEGDNNFEGDLSEMSFEERTSLSLNYLFEPEVTIRDPEHATIPSPHLSSRRKRLALLNDGMHDSEHLPLHLEQILELTDEVDAHVGRSKCSRESVRQGWIGRESSRKGLMAPIKDSDTDNEKLLPYVSSHQCAMLFVDISGFTKLSTLLDAESLSKAINDYFQLIVDEISGHGGDVLKFAGDAVFAEWRFSPKSNVENLCSTIEGCVTLAAMCGVRIAGQCSDYPVYSGKGMGGRIGQGSHAIAHLNVHCGVGVGKLFAVHIGNEMRRENLVLGDPIDQVAEAEGCAKHGEVVASFQCLDLLARSSEFLSESLIESHKDQKSGVIARGVTAMFAPSETFRFQYANRKDTDIITTKLKEQLDMMDTSHLQRFLKLLSLYVHPVSVQASREAHHVIAASMQERRAAEAELRNVCVLFIMPRLSIKPSGDDVQDNKLFSLLNDVFNVTTRELRRFHGHLRQYIVDDKGVVLIATFGLRGSTIPGMIAERALPFATTIHSDLLKEIGVENRIGMTMGSVYCGVVGGILRHEYAALGPSVNLAARLMASTENPGILVDALVRSMAGRTYAFNALPPVYAKGYSDPVPIFEPLDPIRRGWTNLAQNFVAREQELEIFDRLGPELFMSANAPSKIVFITGPSGMGKTTLSLQAIQNVAKTAEQSNKRLILTKHKSKVGDSLIPFSMLQSILVDALKQFSSRNKVVNCCFNDSISTRSLALLPDDCSSASSVTGALISTQIAGHLSAICKELHAPPEFVELVGHHLLRVDIKQHSYSRAQATPKTDESKMQGLINFMALVFRKCTEEGDITIIALDEAHLTDKLSWKVLQRLFETVPNILIICTSRPLSSHKLAVEDEFWNSLQIKHKHDNRFVSMEIGLFSEEKIRMLISKTLDIPEDNVSEQVRHAVFTQSGGSPQYANEILQSMKKQYVSRRRCSVGRIGQTTVYESLGDLILSRVDGFHSSVRHVLNLGAVLGESFHLVEIVDIIKMLNVKVDHDMSNNPHYLQAMQSQEALEVAVYEGVLHMEYGGGAAGDTKRRISLQYISSVSKVEDVSFSFSHEIWRSSILRVMLDSQKRETHRIIALTLESRLGVGELSDFLSKTRLFHHWRGSGNFSKASSAALNASTDFISLGLYDQSIQMLHDAIGILNRSDAGIVDDDDKDISISKCVLDTLTVDDVECLVKLYVALGKCLASTYNVAGSVECYQAALMVLKDAKTASDLNDRSVGFPIFSGLFIALKFGHIKQDSECSYERNLVARFVEETELNGDPVHFARALAMQGEMYARLGDFSSGLASHSRLAEVYVAEEHHEPMSQAYGSDRSAQSFGCSAVWLAVLGRTQEALKTCRFVVDNLMPKMNVQNVHNSFVMLYPVIFIMKDNGRQLAMEARALYKQYFGDPFDQYYGKGGNTFGLPLYQPIMMCFDLFTRQEEDFPEFHDYLKWALEEGNLRLGLVINNGTACYGRMADAICAEICLLLAKRLKRGNDKERLVHVALQLAEESRILAAKANAVASLRQLAEMTRELEALANELGVE